MIVISDIPTYLLENTFKKKGIVVSQIISFPSELNKLNIENDEFLILVGDIFYKEISKDDSTEEINSFSYEILNILFSGLNFLAKKNNKIFISLIPTHFLFSDRKSSNYLKCGSTDFYINELNNKIIKSYRNNENIYFIDGVKHIGENVAKDYFRYSSFLDKSYSEKLANQIIDLRERINYPKKKLIIFDLDNTLWKGIIGDDSSTGIKMDPSDPIGKIFHNVQKILLNFKNKGFLLAICSKNEEENALKVLFSHESSLIRKNDVVTYRINWQPKSENIKSICNELDLSPKESIFLDDSEYECDEVRKNCKNITIFKVPRDIYNYPYLLKNSIFFETSQITIEDKKRTLLYKQRSERKKIIKESMDDPTKSKKSWLESLNTTIHIELVHKKSEYIERIVQLFNRTNQFNLQGRKFTIQSFLKKIDSPKYLFYYGIAKDRIGSEGLISVIGIRKSEKFITISDYILSCRIFGRFIEESMLLPALKIAYKNKLGIYFESKDSSRNIISQRFVRNICGNKSQTIEKGRISSIIKTYQKLPVKVEINKKIIEII